MEDAAEEDSFQLYIWQVLWIALIFTVGVTGNSAVIIVMRKSQDVAKTSPFNVYVFTLAVIDLLASMFMLPDYILRLNVYNPPSGYQGTVMCKLLIGGFLPFSLLYMSLYLLVAICLERRKAILHPFSTLHFKPLWKRLLIIVGIIFLGIIYELPTLVGIYYNKDNPTAGNFCAYNTDPVTSLVFHLFSFVFGCVVPALIFLVSFYQINKQLSNVGLQQFHQSHSTQTKLQNEAMKKKTATIRTMRLVVLIFFLCIIPNETVYMLFEFIHYDFLKLNKPLFQVTVLLRYTNSCLNPLLYSFTSKQFRTHFIAVFPVFKTILPKSRSKEQKTRSSSDKNGRYSLIL